MWGLVSNLPFFGATSPTATSSTSPTTTGQTTRSASSSSSVVPKRANSQNVKVASLTPAALKQLNHMSRASTPQIQVRKPAASVSSKPSDVLSDVNSDAELDMLSDYEFELVDAAGKSGWVEIRKPSVSDASKPEVSKPPSPKQLYSSVVKAGLLPKNEKKRRKLMRKQLHSKHLHELEVSQERRLASTGM